MYPHCWMIRGQYLPSTLCQHPSTILLTTSLWEAVLQTSLCCLILAFLYHSSTAAVSDSPPPSTGGGGTRLECGIWQVLVPGVPLTQSKQVSRFTAGETSTHSVKNYKYKTYVPRTCSMLQTHYPSVSFESCHILKMVVSCICIGLVFIFQYIIPQKKKNLVLSQQTSKSHHSRTENKFHPPEEYNLLYLY